MMAAAAGGGDLFEGQDESRNAALSALRSAFLAPSEEEASPVAMRDAARVGLYLDLPSTRWGFNILPHHRQTLNVFQPQYTLMFEKLLATPEPWLYAHILLPGGVENLGNPEYALEPGTSAPLHGTLMQVMAVQRETDSRLTLLVQGLARGYALRPTQELPYARVDFALLADDEQLAASARHAEAFLERERFLAALVGEESIRALRRRMVCAASTAEEVHWRAYEHANRSLSMHLSLCQVIAC